jgi:hypothetical protein
MNNPVYNENEHDFALSVLLHITNVSARCFIYPTTKHKELQRRKVKVKVKKKKKKKITCPFRMELCGLSLLQNNF